jgi:hypothetical protein
MDLQGDSATLRAQSVTLRSAAAEVTDIAHDADRRLDSMHFRGPAADRFRSQMDDRLARLRRVGQELEDIARLVELSASTA